MKNNPEKPIVNCKERDHLGQIVLNGEIVSGNWFKRNLERVWDFIYFHILPIRTWSRLVDLKNSIKYGFQRMFRGHDKTICWGYESSIKFYKCLLSDLLKCEQGFPAFDLSDICPEEWKKVDAKWRPRLLKKAKYNDCYVKKQVFKKGVNIEEFEDDVMACWKEYIANVLHCFMEADPDTCSLTPEYEELLKQVRLPFDSKDRQIVLHNGIYVVQYPSKPYTKDEDKVHNRLREIDEYQTDMLKKGMAEVAKNILILND